MALREILAKFGVSVDTTELVAGKASVNSFTSFLKSAADKVKNGFGFQDLGVNKLVGDLQGQAGAIGKAAKLSGASTNDIQRLMFQTGKGADDLSRAFRVLGRNMSLATAKQGAENLSEIDDVMGGELPGSGKKATQLFKSLGISIDEIEGRNPSDVFVTMAEKIAQIGDVASRNRAAQLAFGPDGPSLIKDTETLRALGEEYDKIGGFTDENIKSFKALGAAQKTNDLAWNKLKILLGTTFLPILTQITKAGTAVYKWLIDATKGTQAWTVAAGFVVAALVAMNAQSLLLMAKWALMALPWIALFLVIEDIVTFLTGGQSVIGDILDSIGEKLGLGKGVAQEAQKAFADAWNELVNTPLAEQFADMWADIVRLWRFGFGETWTGFLEWADKLDASIADFVRTFPEHAKQAASDFIEGLIDGLTGKASKVLDAVKNVGKGIKDAFAGVLGIHSPSTVARSLMANFDAGGAQGFAGGLTVGAAAETAEATSDAFAPAQRSRGGSSGPTTIDGRQTNTIEQHFHGMGGAQDVANAARDGAAQVLNDDRRAWLAALETVAP